jgi:hypothetical protein
MVVKALHVKQGDLSGTGTEFIRLCVEEPTGQESERP